MHQISSQPARSFSEFASRFSERGIAILFDENATPARAVLVVPAKEIQPEKINELLQLTGGLLFVALTRAHAENLMLVPMPERSPTTVKSSLNTAYVSVEAREGVTTGISAADRALTIRLLAEEPAQPRKLVRPGHVFPVGIADGGVLVRNALPEGAADLCRLVHGSPCAVYSDLLSASGAFMNRSECQQFAAARDLPLLELGELVQRRLESEQLVMRVAEARLPTEAAGEVRALIYRSTVKDGEHVALIKGNINGSEPVLTRVQRESTLTDVFGGTPDTQAQLHHALTAIGKRGSGVLIYLRPKESLTMSHQLASHEGVMPRVTMMREYGIGAQILRDLGISKIELLTGSLKSLAGLTTFGIEIVAQHPMPSSDNNRSHPEVKQR